MKPSFCYIAPTAYLDLTAASNTHLVLAHLVDTDPVYASFYYKRFRLGDYIIMDNSAYELKTPYAPTQLIDLGKKCGAHAIVLPDYPFQPGSVTIQAANEFIPIFKDNGFQTFFVPQSDRGDLDDWLKSYAWAASCPQIDIIGMSILGIPNALPHIDPSFARVVMTEKLISLGIFNFDKHHHYLGLNAGPALEIPSLLEMNALTTIDSSGPIQAALMGHQYTKDADSFQTVKKLKMPVDFSVARTNDVATLDRIQYNINMTQHLFDMPHLTDTWYAEE